jgi:hypothetical protein
VSKSQRHIAQRLAEHGFEVSHKMVGRLLDRLGFIPGIRMIDSPVGDSRIGQGTILYAC